MPDLFGPFTLKDVTLRNRIAMSPTTRHRSVDGAMGDHVVLCGSRAAGGFGFSRRRSLNLSRPPPGRSADARIRTGEPRFPRMIFRDIPGALA